MIYTIGVLESRIWVLYYVLYHTIYHTVIQYTIVYWSPELVAPFFGSSQGSRIASSLILQAHLGHSPKLTSGAGAMTACGP